MIKVVIADDHILFSEGIKSILESTGSIKVLEIFSDGKNLLNYLKTYSDVDVILLDLEMPLLDGVDTFKLLKLSKFKVIILSTHYNNVIVSKMLKNGASSYIAKNDYPQEIIKAIKEVHDHGYYVNSKLINMLATFSGNVNLAKEVTLSEREKEVLILICKGFTNAKIAESLFLSKRTVEGHRSRILSKLSCNNTVDLILYSIRNNYLKVGPNKFN